MNDIFHTCYYINLNRSIERNNKIIKKIKNLKRVAAIDGEDIKLKGIISHVNFFKSTLYYDNIVVYPWPSKIRIPTISYSELGCCLSHLKAIINAYIHGENEIIIMEDDIDCKYINNWNENIYDILKNKPEDTDCILLFCSNPSILKKTILLKEKFIKWNKDCWSTVAYYINRRGMKKIYDKYIKNNTLVINNDIPIADILIYKSLNTYVYTKPLFNHTNNISTIKPNYNVDISSKLIDEYFTNKK